MCLSRRGANEETQPVSGVRRPWVPSTGVAPFAQQVSFPAVPPLGGCSRLGVEGA